MSRLFIIWKPVSRNRFLGGGGRGGGGGGGGKLIHVHVEHVHVRKAMPTVTSQRAISTLVQKLYPTSDLI